MTDPRPPAPATSAGPAGGGARNQGWALCVATLDRLPELRDCVRLAAAQTFPPQEVVICDASAEAGSSRAEIERVIGGSIALTYLQAERKSSAAQRNQCIAAATADILFLLDDDSFMHPDCAERIMATYGADTDRRIAAISATPHRTDPRGGQPGNPARRDPTYEKAGRLSRNMTSRRVRRLVIALLLPGGAWSFIRYRDGHPRPGDGVAVPPGLRRVNGIAGFLLTVRREVAAEFGFDRHLLAYCPNEDADATHRFARRGLLLRDPDAHIYHFEAAAGRLKRRKVAELQVTNTAYFIRRHSAALPGDALRFTARTVRRLIAGVVKDGVLRDWSLPQVRGIARGLLRSAAILSHRRDDLGPWYEKMQHRILAE